MDAVRESELNGHLTEATRLAIQAASRSHPSSESKPSKRRVEAIQAASDNRGCWMIYSTTSVQLDIRAIYLLQSTYRRWRVVLTRYLLSTDWRIDRVSTVDRY